METNEYKLFKQRWGDITTTKLKLHVCTCIGYEMFCPGYLEWWSDSNLHLVLFIQYILNTVSVAYI